MLGGVLAAGAIGQSVAPLDTFQLVGFEEKGQRRFDTLDMRFCGGFLGRFAIAVHDERP